MSRVWVTINWEMCQKCIFLVLINGSVYATAGPLYREYGNYKHLALRNALNASEAPRTTPLPTGGHQPGVTVTAGAVVKETAVPLNPTVRVGILAVFLSVSIFVLVMCLLNVCAASPDCCPYEPGAIVDSDYSSESLAYARWMDAPRTCIQRCARTLTRLFIPLRAHAFYLPSRTDLDCDHRYSTNPWPARIRALLFLSGGRDFPALRSCGGVSSSPRILSSRSSSPLSEDSDGVAGSASSPDTREDHRRNRRRRCRQRQGTRHPHHHSEGERRGQWPQMELINAQMQLGSFGFPKSLFATSTDISDKQLLKRLQRLERRLSRSEGRALRREARERRQADAMCSYNRHSTRDCERLSRRRDKKRKKRERKHRTREKRQKEKRRHGEMIVISPPGSPVATTSTGGKGTLLLEVLAPAKDVSLSSSGESVTHSPTIVH